MSSDDRKYRIRRAILRALFDAARPLTFADLLEDGNLTAVNALENEVQTELTGLCEHEYCCNLRPGRTGLYKINHEGLDQIRKDADLQEYIWGIEASKFQR